MSEIKKFPFTEILGWSVSRYDRFKGCKRQYFFDYYAKYDREIPLEKIQMLKGLTSKALETGNIVHDIIKAMLERFQKSPKPINKDKFYKFAYDLTARYCAEKTFFETHYLNTVVTAQEIYEKVKLVLDNFLGSERFAWLQKYAVPESQKWIIEPAGFGETRINGYKAFCKVDFLFPVADKVYILDWKTGKPDEEKHAKQLTGYSVWANFHFGKEAKDIIPMIVYLYPAYAERSVKIDAQKIEKFAKTVEEESKEMYEYLADIEKNIPKDKAEFHRTDNQFFCKYCSYREICK